MNTRGCQNPTSLPNSFMKDKKHQPGGTVNALGPKGQSVMRVKIRSTEVWRRELKGLEYMLLHTGDLDLVPGKNQE